MSFRTFSGLLFRRVQIINNQEVVNSATESSRFIDAYTKCARLSYCSVCGFPRSAERHVTVGKVTHPGQGQGQGRRAAWQWLLRHRAPVALGRESSGRLSPALQLGVPRPAKKGGAWRQLGLSSQSKCA